MSGTKQGFTTIALSLKNRQSLQTIQDKAHLTPDKAVEALYLFYINNKKQ